LGATEIVTAPPPRPEPPAAIAIHGASLRADHSQPGCAETTLSKRPPAAGTVSRVRLNVNWQVAAACPISTLNPFTTTAPRRSVTTVLPAAV
jgi:hypothetical protein